MTKITYIKDKLRDILKDLNEEARFIQTRLHHLGYFIGIYITANIFLFSNLRSYCFNHNLINAFYLFFYYRFNGIYTDLYFLFYDIHL